MPEVRGILPRGGTILGSSRTNPFADDGGPERIAENLAAAGVDGLIAIGGEDTLGAASRLHTEHGLPVVGVPKTIDNDLGATDYTFGFDTAINIAMEAIDRLHTTADSHHRVLIVEVMGRHAGWIAFHAGLAGGANVILIPERQFDVEQVCDLVGRRFASHFAPIIVVAEGAEPMGGVPSAEDDKLDAFGHVRLGGVGHWLEGEIERRTGKETRATVLGHVQRGGTPTAFDRVLATRFGLHAIDAAKAGQLGDDDGAARDRDRAGAADRGDGGAEDGAGVAVRGGRGLLWLGRPGLERLSEVRWPSALGARSGGGGLRRRRGGRGGGDRERLRRSAALRRGQAGAGERRGGGRGTSGSRHVCLAPRRQRAERSTWPRSAPTPAAPPRTRPPSPTSNARSRTRFSPPDRRSSRHRRRSPPAPAKRDGPTPPTPSADADDSRARSAIRCAEDPRT